MAKDNENNIDLTLDIARKKVAYQMSATDTFTNRISLQLAFNAVVFAVELRLVDGHDIFLTGDLLIFFALAFTLCSILLCFLSLSYGSFVDHWHLGPTIKRLKKNIKLDEDKFKEKIIEGMNSAYEENGILTSRRYRVIKYSTVFLLIALGLLWVSFFV